MQLQVGVIFGGRTVEHEISIISAMQCIDALDKERFAAVPIYISKKGEWYIGDALRKLDNYKDMDKLLSQATKILCSQNSGCGELYKAPPCGILGSKLLAKVDVIFPVMHGTYGEDGSLQGLFELMDIPYVGSNVISSAVSMDKVVSKFVFKSLDIPVVDCMWFYSYEWIEDHDRLVSDVKKRFSYPLIVKPATLGSSIGVSSVKNDEELENAIDLAVSMAEKIMLEPKVQNLKEVNCAVLGDHQNIEFSALEEPLANDLILSYADKYISENGAKGKVGFGVKNGSSSDLKGQGMSNLKRKIPADISEEMAEKIRDYARRAFLGLDCSGVARLDFLLDSESDDIYLCEINPIPGSLSFYLWEPKGKDFTLLTTQLIELALKRHREKSNLISSYATNVLAMQPSGKA